ncbi:uncharacterized protein LOC114665257 [Erpetoichthys calabaricus]|uniref:uncharacterized protein LOC114665257 n=1 Tax=Erpetoichthys calabaricus TaxID=27687 RepID=UPI00109F8985|nr:uncharacterized protein LOC114665257 [Erpetoichthys calabaricus]
MWIHRDKANDQRRYNAPTENEIAIVFRSNNGEPPFERDISVHSKNAPMQNISILIQHCDPMTYPILFPYGDKGWISGTKLVGAVKRENLTHLQYYAYRLATRNEFKPIFSAGKLFQQYVVDAYCKIEANQIHFHRSNQAQLRSDLYSGLMDHINNLAENKGVKPGTIYILPSTFQGSPRAHQQNFQDAMAIVRKHGGPDVFMTMTMNPKCCEVMENLKPEERPEDRPDLVARSFKEKLTALLHDLFVNKVLGVVIAHVYVIEFQKCGLPHCHLLLFLRPDDKPRTVEIIDKLVCCEIPDPVENPRLYEIVKATMVQVQRTY